MSEQKKKHGFLKVLLAILIILLVVALAGVLTGNHFLGKINFLRGDETSNVDGVVLDGESVNLPDGFSGADSDIADNILDTRLWYHDDVINILLAGLDNVEREGVSYPRSDAVLLLSINKKTQQINLISLSRASYVSIPGYGNARLNSAYSYGGGSLLEKTVELNYKIRIDNYISVNTEAFAEIIDILGGVDVQMSYKDMQYVRAVQSAEAVKWVSNGVYHLNGEAALTYSRMREMDSDRDRTQRQRDVLTAIAKKGRSMDLSTGIDLLNRILPKVSTDFTKIGLLSQAVNALTYIQWPINQSIVPTDTPVAGKNFVEINGYEVIILNWAKTRNELHELLYPGVELQQPLK